MAQHAFLIVDNRVVHIANPSGAGMRYLAHAVGLSPSEQSGAIRHETAETLLVVCRGTIEVMINGATAVVGAGNWARVPPGAVFAYRNAGAAAAQLLVRTAPPSPIRTTRRITLQIAAA